jgi:peptidoglycan L-alanyl-D-glutamate endopeptidase CwlK
MKLNTASIAKLRGVHPDLVRVVTRCAADWKDAETGFIVTCGPRSLAEQKILLRNGKSTTLRSRHIPAKNGFAHAVDLAVVIDGKANWDLPNYTKLAKRIRAAAKAEGVPVEWGGDWAGLVDGPHFQLPWNEYPGKQ